VPVGTYESGPDGEWLLVNKRWSELSGLEPYEAAGNGWAVAVHPDDRSRVLAAWHELVEMGREFSDAEYRFLRPDRTVVWVAANAVTIRDGYGEVTGFLGTAREITDRVELEAALKRKTTELDRVQARLEEAQAMTRVGRWGWDPAAASLSWSAEQCRLHGLEPAAAAPGLEAFLSVVHPADRNGCAAS
jgi:PAS domain S-box-containing protein